MTALRYVSAIALATLLLSACQSLITSENNEQLRKLLQQRPQSDLDGDGVLTASEARQWQAQREAKRAERQRKIDATPTPDHVNVAYGSHERHRLDLYEANTPVPSPLIVYFHGGGFLAGDKDGFRLEPNRERYLEAGIAFAGARYRYRTTAPIQDVLRDAARAIQFLRANAERFHIDPERIAVYGGSAGAGISLWLAFHDDLADPAAADPIARASSRVTAAGAIAPQFSYDMTQWESVLGVDPLDFYDPDPFFYGLEEWEDVHAERARAVLADVDMRGLITPDDPPIYLLSRQEDKAPDSIDSLNHHPRHSIVLKERLDEIGVPAELYLPALGSPPPGGEDDAIFQFFTRHLLPITTSTAPPQRPGQAPST